MADKKISQLTASTVPLAGTEVLPIVQSGDTVKVSVANLTAGRAVSASSITATSAAFATDALNIDSTNNRVVIGKGVPGIKKVDIQVAANDGIRIYRPGASVAHILAVDGGDGIKFEVEGVGNALTIDSSRNIGVSAGNLVIGTAGKGIDFSADPSPAGMTSELLDDYEEGTWTPAVSGSTSDGSVVYTTQVATYTKIGNRVFFNLQVQLNGAHSGTGNILIKGLPYACNATYGSATTQYANSLNVAVVTALQFVIVQGESQIRLFRYVAGAASALPMSNLNTDSNIIVSGNYVV